MTHRTCSMPDCDNKHGAQGLCHKHYTRAYLAGQITPTDKSHWHTMTDVDEILMVGTCSACGPGIEAWKRKRDGKYMCRPNQLIKNRAQRKKLHADEKYVAWHNSYQRARKYGLRVGDIEAMVEAVDSRCEICSTPVTVATAHVDHDHSCCAGRNVSTCGQCIRGILCRACNHGIGFLRDDPAILAAASDYIVQRAKQNRAA